MYRLCGIFLLAATPLAAQEITADDFHKLERQNDTLARRIAELEDQLGSWQSPFVAASHAEESTPASCPPVTCCPAPDLWRVRAGIVTLARNEEEEDDDDDDDEFEIFDPAVGPYISALRRMNDCLDLEFIFFGVDGWDGGQSAIGLPFGVRFRSEFYNYEVNARYRLRPRIALITGFRWMTLDDEFRLMGPGAFGRFTADNDLFGWQWGIEAILLQRRGFSLELLYKLGVYDTSSKIVLVSNGPFNGRFHGGGTSFGNDLWITAAFQLTERLSFRGGYQLIYVTDTATSLFLFGEGPEYLFAQGAHAMLEARF